MFALTATKPPGVVTYLACVLVFLFPIAGNTIKSWTGFIFFALALLGIFCSRRIKLQLYRDELILIALPILLFLAFLISDLINGWDHAATRGLGIYLRWIFLIPIFLLIRQMPYAFFWLAVGSSLGAMVLFGQSVYELFFDNRDRVYGVYDSPGLVATQSLCFLLVIINFLGTHRSSKTFVFIFYIGMLTAATNVILSGSRSTYFTALALLILAIGVYLRKPRKFLLFTSVVVALFGLLYLSNPIFNRQVSSAINEISTYAKTTDTVSANHGSVGIRLEMWKVSLLIAQENPVFGVGWRGFQDAARPFAKAGQVSSQAAEHPHPHNTYLEFLVTTGLFGFSLLMLLFLMLLLSVKRAYRNNPKPSLLLLSFTTLIVFNSINEGGMFIYGNSLSFFIVYLAIVFSQIYRTPESSIPFFARQSPVSLDSR